MATEEEEYIFNCNDSLLQSMIDNGDKYNPEELDLINDLKEEKKVNVQNGIKIKLGLSSEMGVHELNEYLEVLEQRKVITINQQEYQKTKTDKKGFKCMLNITLEEIKSLFSNSANLATFLTKTILFTSEKQETTLTKQEFEIIRIHGDMISFYIFSLEFELAKHSRFLSLFKIESMDCRFEKYSATITTNLSLCDEFYNLYSDDGKTTLKEMRKNLLKPRSSSMKELENKISA